MTRTLDLTTSIEEARRVVDVFQRETHAEITALRREHQHFNRQACTVHVHPDRWDDIDCALDIIAQHDLADLVTTLPAAARTAGLGEFPLRVWGVAVVKRDDVPYDGVRVVYDDTVPSRTVMASPDTITGRGFRHSEPVSGDGVAMLRVYESSAAAGAHLWIAAEDEGGSVHVHLTVEAARRFAQDVLRLCDLHYQNPAPAVHRLDGALDALADDVWAWHRRELGEGTLVGKVAKVAEEAGELVGHTIKSTEPRADAADHARAAEDEVADVIMSALGAARAMGIASIEDVIARKWGEVRQRRFLTAPSLQELRATEQAICPECRQGKHPNCDGQALDPATDEIVRCQCTRPQCPARDVYSHAPEEASHG